MTTGRVQQTGLSPYELANQDVTFALKRTAQLDDEPLPSNWWGGSYPMSSPGPIPTMPTGGASTQPTQTPPNPNRGTQVQNSPPPAPLPGPVLLPADTMYSFVLDRLRRKWASLMVMNP